MARRHLMLKPDDVKNIRDMWCSRSMSIRELAKWYGRKYHTIHDVCLNKTYHDPNYIPTGPCRRWSTREERDQIDGMTDMGMKPKAIAESLGLRYGTVYARMYQRKKKKQQQQEEEAADVQASE